MPLSASVRVLHITARKIAYYSSCRRVTSGDTLTAQSDSVEHEPDEEHIRVADFRDYRPGHRQQRYAGDTADGDGDAHERSSPS